MTPDADGGSGRQGFQTASDGLPAHVVDAWAEEKLHYLERYIQIFTTGMKGKWARRIYIDLFSGPGRSIVQPGGKEIDGSPLRAAKARYAFTDMYFNDADRSSIEALQRRISDSSRPCTFSNLDCNQAARDVGERLRLDAAGTLGLAFIDPYGFQIDFDAITRLTRNRSIDLIITVMTGYLRRFIDQPSMQPTLDRFFGSPHWRDLVELKASGEQVTYRRLLDSYEDRLRGIGYKHVDDDIRILNSRESTIYHLVFASKHARGADFFKKISGRRFSGQRRLDL